MKKSNSLTVRYGVQQMTYWGMFAGVVSFAATYLLDKGFHASQVGIILACANFSSCMLQPMLASYADRLNRPILPRLIAMISALSFGCFGVILLFSPPLPLFAFLYFLGVMSLDAMLPLLNAINVYYNARQYHINYGIGRGLGSLAFALFSLPIGYIMQLAGSDWMICITLALLTAFVITTLGYPKVEAGAGVQIQAKTDAQSCSLPDFFRKYKWYSISLLGILLIAMFHAMSENYFIEVFRRLGGGSGNVGTALSIATLSAVPVLFYFDRIHRRLSSHRILLTAGVMFTLKSVLLLLAPSVLCIYLIELLQTVTYAFISPVQMYYAREQVEDCDMVKGQAFITASYALGCALGNLTGGFLVGYFSVVTMLSAGIVMAAAGTAVLFISLRKV